MLIDWFTVIAQVINFLVLVWLLKRFLYRPILDAIDAREKRIAAELASADATKADAEKQRLEFEQKNIAIDKAHTTRMAQLTEEIKSERMHALNAVREESDALRKRLQAALDNERNSLQEVVSEQARREVFAIARQVLNDLAGTTLESSMVDIFVQRLRELNDVDKAALLTAFSTSTQALTVRSAFALSDNQRSLIETTINEVLQLSISLTFATEPSIGCGIELSSNGQKVAWSIDDYLTSLAQSVDELLRVSDNNVADNQSSKVAKTAIKAGML